MNSDSYENGEEDERKQGNSNPASKKSNILPLWGNERSMNLNPLILTNIQSSHYFKVNLYELKTYHEVIDEIYYKVAHLEPWEKGSRKTSGQTGMCGGVRGVGAGGIVSTAYCLLYKLFTLKLTRKQLNGLITHPDSPYIRALGFMYIRYTQPPPDLWDWYDDYLEDTEEVDVKAGGGQVMTIGAVLRSFLSKLEWFSTLFPRIPVPIQQKIEKNLNGKFGNQKQPVKPRAVGEGEQEKVTARFSEKSRERDRREVEKRDTTDRREVERRDVDRREIERKESDRRDTDRKEADRRDTDRRDVDRRDTDRREVDRREVDRREVDRREVDRRDMDRKDTDRRDMDRREPDRKEMDRREPERRDMDRRDMDRRELEKRGRRDMERNGSRGYDKHSDKDKHLDKCTEKDRYLDRDKYSDREYSDRSRTNESSRNPRDRERWSKEKDRQCQRSRSRNRQHHRVY